MKINWNKPQLKVYGTLEQMQKRIERLQKLIKLYIYRHLETNNPDDRQKASNYMVELTEVQNQYSKLLKSKAHETVEY
jgi:hypothetical protein